MWRACDWSHAKESDSLKNAAGPEHYVTLFDSRFLACGLTLFASLRRVDKSAELWVVCIDQKVEQQIASLSLEGLHTISLGEVENDRLRSVKAGRTLGEYCWTLTPFSIDAVFSKVPSACRATYIDADLFFINKPERIFTEFSESNAHVLITEHGYAPNLDRSHLSGRFCVQFMVFRNTTPGLRVLRWWQDRCIEWCFDRNEDGKFGDQKYLDVWPVMFRDEVHILSDPSLTLAPWNIDYMLSIHKDNLKPTFYHFQSLRLIDRWTVRLYSGVKLSRRARQYYFPYLDALKVQVMYLESKGISVPSMPEPVRRFGVLRRSILRLLGRVHYVRLAKNG